MGLGPPCERACKACNVCCSLKHNHKKCGPLPLKEPELIPWHALCIDLIGECPFGDKKKGNCVTLRCMTRWFKIAEVPNARADCTANVPVTTWLSQCPWPTEMRMGKGEEFADEVSVARKEQCAVCRKVTTTRNPQANSMVERIHQVIGNMTRSGNICGSEDPLDKDFWLERSCSCCAPHSQCNATHALL